ncbi:MAG: ketopantoate reductase family protein [Clostridia bacterium]|nr:ketopantoate reductase family protein [Clostridia bacterium]
MKPIQSVYISGLGAIGSAYAAKLFEMNPACVKVIVDTERKKRYSKDGITVNDTAYAFDYIVPEDDVTPADLIIIAVKQHHLEESIKSVQKFIAEDTIILSLLNGISSEEILGKVFGTEKLLYSYVVGTDAVRETTNTHYSKIGQIVFGEPKNTCLSPKVAAVKELFEKAGIPYSIPEDMLRSQWWKFMLNVGINQVSAILRAPYAVFQHPGEALELMKLASREVVALSQKKGINLKEEDIEEYVRVIKTLSPGGKTSMLQDVEAGRKTEVEIFSGTVIELGQQYGVPTPVNDVLFKLIRSIEQLNT